MNQALYSFHQAHKERIARMEAKAYRPPLVVVPDPEPTPEPQADESPFMPPEKPTWFSIEAEITVRPVKISDIQREVCRYFEIYKTDLISDRRDNKVVIPRHIGMYLSRFWTTHSYPEIGRRFNRDHTVPIFAFDKIGKRLPVDLGLAFDVAHIERNLGVVHATP